jgi:hypothetical protein
MRNYIILLAIGLGCISVQAQLNTNLTPAMTTIWNGLSPGVQADTLALLEGYNKACRRSPEFAGVSTNSVYDETGTNVIGSIVTTNHVRTTLADYLTKALAHEKISRVIQAQNDSLRQEMYSKVGKTVVDAWTE